MSIVTQTETQARQKIEDLCVGLGTYDIAPVEREPKEAWRYTVSFAVITKNGGFDSAFITSVFEFCAQSDGLFEFGGTRREIHDLDFEILVINAEVTP